MINELWRNIVIAIISVFSVVIAVLESTKITVSIPVAINASLNSLLFYKQTSKMKIDIGTLNKRAINWLTYLSTISNPAGIIHNNSDTVVWVNNNSSLKVGTKTTKSHVSNSNLLDIKENVIKLEEVSIDYVDNESYYIKENYILSLNNNNIEVIDRFYKLTINNEVFRIFICDFKRSL